MPQKRADLHRAADTAFDRVPDGSWPLYHVAQALKAVSEAERVLEATVYVARGKGATWAQIARVVGVSRQAAQARFGEV